MALLSKSAEYGLRAVLYVAVHRDRKYVPIGEMSKELRISFHFLTKILQKLTERGFLRSARGPGGGVALARPAGRITLLDIIAALDGADLFAECLLGLDGCGEKDPCPLHRYWARERTRIEGMFKRVTLAKLARHVVKNELRLSN